MSELLERTRQACLERIRTVRRALESVRDPSDASCDLALRELHAIKGETAMAGLRVISKVAHGLETLIIQRRQEEPLYLADAIEALRVLADVLSSSKVEDLVGSSDVEELLDEIRAAGGGAASQRGQSKGARTTATEHQEVASEPQTAANGTPSAQAVIDESRGAPAPQGGWIRVGARSIESLSNLMSEVSAELDGARAALAELSHLVDQQALSRAQALADQLDTVRSRVADAEERAWNLRLVAISPALQDLADHVDGLARQLGKKIEVHVDAQGVALERGAVEALREPLMHLARNAVDHGIEPPSARHDKSETGRVSFHAESQGGEVIIAVEDDGAGIDVEAVRSRAVELKLVAADRARLLSFEEVVDLVFANGFSQRDEASEISGRGGGLAAVRSAVEGLGGAVRLSTTAGRGSRFELVLPAAVARERVLVVETAGLPWAIPSRWVRSVVRQPDTLERARRERTLRLQDGLVPARPLNAWLGAPREDESAAVVVEIAGRRTALLVGRIEVEVDLLRSPTDALVAAATRVAASGILSDGRAAFFLRWAEVLREVTQLADDGVVAQRKTARKPRVLIVDDSPVIRDIVGEVLSGAGIEVLTAVDGKVALELVQTEELDLVVSDIEMPRMNGLELLQSIRKQTEVLPVVMLTTRSKPEHRREAALMGANAYIAKSEFHGDTLMEVVRRFVDVRGS